MSKAVIGVVGGVAVVAVAVVGGAAWSGQAAQRQLEGQVADLQTLLPLKASEARYEKGLFSATHTVVLTSACDSDDDEVGAEGDGTPGQAGGMPKFSVTVRQRIQHGPFPGFTRLGWSVIDTELLMPENLQPALKDATPGQALLTAHTEVGLGGGFTSRIATPVLDLKEEGPLSQLNVQPLVLTLSGPSLSGSALRYELAWPGLNGSGSTGAVDFQIKVGALTGQGEVTRIGKTLFGSGKEQFDWQRLEVLATPKDPTDRPTSVVLSDLKFHSETGLDGNELLSGTSHLQAQAQVNELKVSKIDLAGSMKRLHAPTYAQLMQQAWSPNLMCRDAADAEAIKEQGEQLVAAMTALLPHNPEMGVDKAVVEIDGQAGEFCYTLGTQGVTAEEAASPELRTVLFAKAHANGHLKVPLAWIERILVDKRPERQAQDKAMMDAMLGQAVDAGYVVRDGETLSSQFKLEKGQLLVNGKPIGPQLAP